jgi:hypothetical protein
MPGAFYMDVGGTYNIRQDVTAYFKVDNLFDRDPAKSPNYANPALYDIVGRMYRAKRRPLPLLTDSAAGYLADPHPRRARAGDRDFSRRGGQCSRSAASAQVTGRRWLSPRGLRATSSISFTPATGTESDCAAMPHLTGLLVASSLPSP